MFKFYLNTPPVTHNSKKRWAFKFKDVNFDELNYCIEELNLLAKIQSQGDNINLA